MKKLILLNLMLLLISWSLNAQTATTPSGNGTEATPYQITNLENLYWISVTPSVWDKYFIQTANIDASTTSEWSGGSWLPIGNLGTYFSGNYNGNSKIISGLRITTAPSAAFGLFGTANGATFRNLGITNVDIDVTVEGYVGALVGTAHGVTINNCYSTGNIKAGVLEFPVGGLAGGLGSASNMIKCFSTCNVSGARMVGGLVGSNNDSSISESHYMNGTVEGIKIDDVYNPFSYAGGLVADNNCNSSISKCYSTGTVIGFYYAGGLVARNACSGSITNSYSRCSCKQDPYLSMNGGGLVGYNMSGASITNCYFAGTVFFPDMGGLIGNVNEGTVQNSFWDSEVSGAYMSDGGTYKTTAEMKTLSTFIDVWDFTTIWGMNPGINNGYPYLLPESECTNGTIALTYELGTNNQSICANSAITPIVYTVGGGASGATISPALPDGLSVNYDSNENTFTISGTPTGVETYEYTVTTAGTASPCTEATATGTITVKINPTATAPVLGDGSSGNPYQIASLQNLYWVAATDAEVASPTQSVRFAAHYIQIADIDAAETAEWCTGWVPIGNTWDNYFSGNYNGNGKTISGLYIPDSPSFDVFGLFGYAIGATFQNIGLLNVYINGAHGPAGCLVGYTEGATINNCYSSGTVTVHISGQMEAGGLVGYFSVSSAMLNCYSTCDVSGAYTVGGLVGVNMESTITNSHYTKGTIVSLSAEETYCGGLVGYNSGSISKCYSTGTVNGFFYTGGLVGFNNWYSQISNSYSRCICSNAPAWGSYGGGLVGANWFEATITNCYSPGKVTSTLMGGLVGLGFGTASNSFWNTDVAESGTDWSTSGTGVNTTALKTQSTFTDVGWDFASIWGINPIINDGYPYFLPESDCTNGTLALNSILGTENQTICANSAITPIVYTVGGGASGATILPALPTGLSVNYDSNENTFTISGTPTVAETYEYTVTTSGTESPCTEATASGMIIVSAQPDAGIIKGSNEICVGETSLLKVDGDSGGTWLSSNESVVQVSEGGILSALLPGTSTITYTVAGTSGCDDESDFAELDVTVNPLPDAGTIQGEHVICIGNSIVLTSDGDAGGTWSSNDEDVATVNQAGFVEGWASGTATITYTVYGTVGCVGEEDFTTFEITVSSPPEASFATIASNTPICETDNAEFYLTGTPNVVVSFSISDIYGATDKTVTLDPAGQANVVVSGAAKNQTMLLQNVQDPATGCTTLLSASAVVEVKPLPFATFAVTANNGPICSGEDVHFFITGTPGSLLTYHIEGAMGNEQEEIDASGKLEVTISSANSDITINLILVGYPDGLCPVGLIESSTVIVNPLPVVSISGETTIFVGETTSLSPSSGGTWTSSNIEIATVTDDGLVTGIAIGTATFTFTDATTGCSTTTSEVTVNKKDCVPGTIELILGNEVQTVCPGTAISSIEYYIGGGATGAEVTGLPVGVNGNFSAGIFTISGTPTIVGSYEYTVSTTGTESPCTEATATGTISVNTNPEVRITGNNSPICYDKDAKFYLAGTPGVEVVYSIDGGATTRTVRLNGGTAIVTAMEALSNVTLSHISICNNTLDIASTVIVNPLPTAGISGVSYTCNTILTAETNASNPIYTWYYEGGLISGEHGSTLDATQSGNYWLAVTDAGCGKLSEPFAVTVHPNPEVRITSNNSPICYDKDAKFYLEGTPGAEVVYSFDGGTTLRTIILNGGTATVTGMEATSDVTLSLMSICNTAVTGTSTVTVYPIPTASISGAHNTCTSTTLTAETDASSPKYFWASADENGWHLLGEGPTLEVTQSDTYWLAVVDGITGCENYSDAFEVTLANQQLDIICPVTINTNRNTNTGLCSYTAVLTEFDATATNNCGETELTYSLSGVTTGTGTTLAGIVFNKGLTTVTWSATDGESTPVTCSFTVTVIDNENPVLIPVVNQEINLESDCSITFPDLVKGSKATDNCPGIVITQDPEKNNGTTLSHNETFPITVTATDASGNKDSKTVILTAKDVTPPVISCPEAITKIADVSINGAVVTYVTPVGTDNCGGVITAQTEGLESGSIFPVGVTTNTFLVTDAAGLTAECSFTVTVDATPVAGTLAKTPDLSAVCEGTEVSAILIPGSGGNGNDELDYRTKTDSEWSGWSTYISGNPIPTTGKSGVEVRTRRDGGLYSPSSYNIVSWEVETTPVAGTLDNWPSQSKVCEGTEVSAMLFAGSGGNGIDELEFRTKTEIGWSVWAPYGDEEPISTAGLTVVEVRTRRMATVCNPSGYNTVSWLMEATPVAAILNKSPEVGTVCEGTMVNAYLSEGPNGEWSGGNGVDQTQYRTETGENWSVWLSYTSGTNISTTGRTGIEIRTRRMAVACTPSDYNIVSWAVEATPVAGILVKLPNEETVCEVTVVSAVLNPGSGGDGTDMLVFRTNNGTEWSEFASYTSGTSIATTGKTAVEVWTRRWGNYCGPSPENIVNWVVEAAPDAGTLSSDQSICPGSIPADLTLTGQTGNVLKYQKSNDADFTSPTDLEFTAATLLGDDIGPLSSTAYFRAVVQIGTCPAVYSNVVTITTGDSEAPSISCPEGKYFITLGQECSALLPDYRSLATKSDNCGTPTVSQSPAPGATILGVGTMTVILTADDGNGNTSTCSFIVHKVDNTPPSAVCKNVTVYLDATGLATVTTEQVDNGSSDNCMIDKMTVEPASFNCDDVGDNPVTLTVYDKSSNSNTCMANVKVVDNTPPTAVCKNITVQLSTGGTATITATDIDGGSSDACGIKTRVASKTSFNCSNLGNNTVILTVTDMNGNSSTCVATVTITERLTTVENLGAFSGQYTDPVILKAILKDNVSGPLQGFDIKFTIGTQTATAKTGTDGIAQVTITLNQDPSGTYKVKAEFVGACPFLNSSDEDDFDILPEIACGIYTGPVYANTSGPTVMTTSITLSAIVSQQGDGYEIPFNPPSNISFKFNVVPDANGSVTLVGSPVFNSNTSTFSQVANVTVKTGNIFTSLDVSWSIAGGFSNDGCSDQRWIVTVAIPTTDYAAGGGHIVLTGNSGGAKAGLEGSKNNFGFGIKWGKNYSKLTGNFNTIWRQADKSFQARSNTASALVITKVGTNQYMAQITYTNVNMRQLDCVTNCWSDGNGTAILTVYDYCEGGNCTSTNSDKIGIAIRSKTGALIYSSNSFDPATKDKITVQNLAGGNIQVKASALKAAEITDVLSRAKVVTPEVEFADLKVYPNPFSEKLRFEFVSPVDAQVRIVIYDITGRMVRTVFDSGVEKGVTYNTEFDPETVISGMYIYRVIMGESVYTGKAIYKK